MAASTALKVIDRDRGWRELRQKLAQAAGGKHVVVGVMGANARAPHGKKGKLTVGDVATIHEFGAEVKRGDKTIVIPERSFLRGTFDEKRPELQQRATAVGRAVLLTKLTPRQGLELLGVYAVGVVKKRIADGIPPPNAPSTIRKKKSSTPLIDKSQLRGAITHEVQG